MKSKVPAFADDRGDEISISKLMNFDDVELLLIEFQCLACSTILPGRQTAVYHYNHFHSNSANDLDCMIKCPICYQEIHMSGLNCHMNSY